MKKQCTTCPFLEVNRNKETPNDFDWNETQWYSQENIDAVWNNMRLMPIQFLSCHSSDPDYYGKDNKNVHACAGAAFLVYMHIYIYSVNNKNDYSNYVKEVGEELALTPAALEEKYFAFKVGRTAPQWGGMILPEDLQFDLENAMADRF